MEAADGAGSEVSTEEGATSDVPAEPTVNQEDIKKLVETLESETARTEFIGNLKTLLDQQEKAEAEAAAALPITEQIGVRGFLSDSVTVYEEFLDRNNLSGSLVNQILGSVVVLAIMLILHLFEKKLHKKIHRAIDKFSSKFEIEVRGLRFYARIFHCVLCFSILAIGGYTFTKIWGLHAIDRVLESEAVRTAISTGTTILLVLFLAALVWESISLYLAYVLRQANTKNHTRAKTLLPIIRNIVVAIFAGLFGLVLLSEIGVNVTPLLAGAGVIGVAVGFGAQSFVKDFLTGFTIILEDIVRVGDVVNLGGLGGSVEKITLRKIQLRDYNGAVYTVPYSEIKIIQNLTKDFSYYVMDIPVGYNSSIEHVVSVLRKVDEDMRKDDSFSFMIMEPLEIAGLDKFADSALIIKARIKTRPIRQWAVGREFNKRLKEAFDAEGIQIPFPSRTINIKSDPAMKDQAAVAAAMIAEASD